MSWKTLLAGALMLMGVGVVAQDRINPVSSLGPPTAVRDMAFAPRTPPPVSGAPAGRDLTKADVDAWLDGYMPYALRAGDIPGAVVTVVKDGQLLTARGFGYADLAKRTPVDPERTLFRPGSVSKLVTWTAAMQMVEQGKLDLDGDVNKYLDFKIPPRDGKSVTLRQLMTHTGGFEEAARGVVFYDGKNVQPLDVYLKQWVPRRIFAPGTTPAYSNWGTALTAYLVQRVSGEEFDAYVERHVFAPLGMKYSTFRQPLPANLAPFMSTGYAAPGVAKGFEYVGPAPAGSLSASGTDMARFMIAHLNGGEFNGQRILRPETAATMHQSPLDRVDPMSLMPPLNRMELGFFETNVNGREVIGHLGDLNAFHTSLHLFLKEGVGFYVSFNSAGKGGAVGPLRTAVFEDFSDRYFPNIAPADGRVDPKTAAEHARMMTGNWVASRRADSSFLSAFYALFAQETISVGPKGELVVPGVKSAGGRPREWIEIAPFVWRDAYGHDRLAAKVVDGKVVRWVFDLAAPFEVFERVPASRSMTWIKPMLYASIAILLLTFLYWPVARLIRRKYKAMHPLSGTPLRADRAVRLMAGLTVVLLVGWMAALTAGLSAEPGAFNAIFYLLQFAGMVIFVGLALVSGWNLLVAFRNGRGWKGKLWSVLVFLSALLLLYLAVIFHLMKPMVFF